MNHSTDKRNRNHSPYELVFYIGLLGILLFVIIHKDHNRLEAIKSRGELIVITRNGPTTYYEGPDGATGFEFHLAHAFAEHLGVQLKMITPESFNDIIPLLNGGHADIAAAGLSITEARQQQVNFGPTYQTITPELIYRIGNTSRPKSLSDIQNGRLEIIAGSSHEENLLELQAEYPNLQWISSKTLSIDDLIYRVHSGDIGYTIVDSNEFKLSRRFYPELRAAFSIGDPQELAWAFPQSEDDSLLKVAVAFFTQIKNDGLLTQLVERHYGHIRKFNYVDTSVFLEHIETRLPEYKSTFLEAGQRFQLDWRLLAAMAYQESHWQSNAASPTGVRGIMMLTLQTAGQLNISNRLDSRESIMGGAEYFALLLERMPMRIPNPDRTWMALAAYNVGFGHLEDARKLTQKHGNDPDKWMNVKESLPLLSQRKWHSQTKHGYARGQEPVIYVQNIRGYYDVLLWLDDRLKKQKAEEHFDPTQILPQAL